MQEYSVFNSLQDIVLVVNEKLELLYGNASAAALFGHSRKRLCAGAKLSDLLSFNPDPLIPDGSIANITKLSLIQECSFKSTAGNEGVVQVSALPQPDVFIVPTQNGEKRWIVFVKDMTIERSLHGLYRQELEQKEGVITELKQARAQLEEYSKNLEIKVEERTAELKQANLFLRTVLDSLGQGILVFERDGKCTPVFSSFCKKLFGREPSGLLIEDFLGLDETRAKKYRDWRETLFEELLEFEDFAALGLKQLTNKLEREVKLEYQPLRGADGKLSGVVVVVTDKTEEMIAVRKAEKQYELVNKVTLVVKNKDSFKLFIQRGRSLLEAFLKPTNLSLDEIKRNLHTLKGAAASFGLKAVAASAHDLEEKIGKLGSADIGNKFEKEAKDILALLDLDIRTLGDVLGQSFDNSNNEIVELMVSTIKSWAETLLEFPQDEKIVQLRVHMLREFMHQPIVESFRHIKPSLVTLASNLGKKFADFQLIGGDIKVPRKTLQPLFAELNHAFRNSIYHGIEAPADRIAAGKPEEGKITMKCTAEDRGGIHFLRLEIKDDGKGIDVPKLRKKLIEKGEKSLENVRDEEVIQWVFKDGVSTSATINEVAGRGVGMSAIAAEVRRLGGKASVESKPGVGMTLTILLPMKELLDADLPAGMAASG